MGRVVEDPTDKKYVAAYAYDRLDNLISVSQAQLNPASATQTRSFNYTTLGRLRSAVNPESGETKYTYYGSGNLWKREDARSFTTTYTYDALNRMLTTSYSGTGQTTPSVTYDYYVTGLPNIGLLEQG